MAAPKRTQKEIAQTYRGNLAYLSKLHRFRSLRWIAFMLAVIGSIGFAVGYRYFGRQEFFSTGPITSTHARFADRCDACHSQADPDLFKALRVEQAVDKAQQAKFSDFATLVKSKIGTGETSPGGQLTTPAGVAATPMPSPHDVHSRVDIASPEEVLAATRSLEKYDQACIRCHESYQLHMPQLAALGLRPVYNEIGLVHAGSCSTCHREHQGPGPMKDPPSTNCVDCHRDTNRLVQGVALMRTAARLASPRAETRDLGDGVRRFLPPRQAPHVPVAFDGFAGKHPSFGYEQPGLKDPAKVQYNHNRHFQPDVTGANKGRQLDCTECHKAGADGRFMQPVNFEQHCQRCHSLHFDPDVPKLAIPHGDPEKVRAYLRSLTSLYVDYGVNTRKITTREELEAFVRGQFAKLHERGLHTAEELERRVFFTGDPPESDRASARTNNGQFFPGCAKCHEIKPHPGSGAPLVTPTNLPDRWLTRGPFEHAPHAHMRCFDCHQKALTSNDTGDILMPTKASCAECHRPAGKQTNRPVVAHAEPIRVNDDLVLRQKTEGGIKFECQVCHPKYHAPAEATIYAKDLKKTSVAKDIPLR